MNTRKHSFSRLCLGLVLLNEFHNPNTSFLYPCLGECTIVEDSIIKMTVPGSIRK